MGYNSGFKGLIRINGVLLYVERQNFVLPMRILYVVPGRLQKGCM
jgi:hypothetical protein